MQSHYRWRNDDGSESAATWKAAIDTPHCGVSVGDTIRLRMDVAYAHPGGMAWQNASLFLEYSANSAAETWIPIPSDAVTEAFEMAASPWVSDGETTTRQLGGSAGWLAGRIAEHPSTATAPISSLPSGSHTEFEFCIKATAAALPRMRYYIRARGVTILNPSELAWVTVLDEGTSPPDITSALAVETVGGYEFSYRFSATGSDPLTLNL